jgi:hypothetical protein
MACGYISSNNNRLYAAQELTYGQVPPVASSNRFPTVKLTSKQTTVKTKRQDKTGTRTYPGTSACLRKQTTFDLMTYMTVNASQYMEPSYGPLFEAALGGAPALFVGGIAAANTNAMLLKFAAPHGLSAGQAVTCGGELRFATAIVDADTVALNAPFTAIPSAGSAIGGTAMYQPAQDLTSVSLFDFWDPADAVQRVFCGAAVNKLQIRVNGDYHEFELSGIAQDVIDNTSFVAGQGGLSAFPAEPTVGAFDYTIIPGNLGEAWLGTTPNRFYTITSATLTLDNGIEMRENEFGTNLPLCISAGPRTVTADFELLEKDDAATQLLYQAARQRTPISIMFQLGQQAGELFGVYLKSVIPEVPDFDDSGNRLAWKFQKCQAQGTGNDEMYIAFG